jgi:hypothetical protein
MRRAGGGLQPRRTPSLGARDENHVLSCESRFNFYLCRIECALIGMSLEMEPSLVPVMPVTFRWASAGVVDMRGVVNGISGKRAVP